MANYLIALDTMIELEEAEHTRYLEKFVQKNVRLTYRGDNQFSFSLTVSFGLIFLFTTQKSKLKDNLKS